MRSWLQFILLLPAIPTLASVHPKDFPSAYVREEIKTLGDNIVVVSAYDGEWHPAGGVK